MSQYFRYNRLLRQLSRHVSTAQIPNYAESGAKQDVPPQRLVGQSYPHLQIGQIEFLWHLPAHYFSSTICVLYYLYLLCIPLLEQVLDIETNHEPICHFPLHINESLLQKMVQTILRFHEYHSDNLHQHGLSSVWKRLTHNLSPLMLNFVALGAHV